MQNWQSEPGEECSSVIDFSDASDVCDRLNIPLHKANFSDEYWDRVFEDFLKEHKAGRTPNPDILCNREIKFKSFLNYALSIGADFIATGHYAALKNINGRTYLCRAKIMKRTRLIFYMKLKKMNLKNVYFLSKLYKNEVRKIAEDINLSVSKKKDSVGICFVGEKNLKDFLGRFMNLEKGPIYDEYGIK